MAWTTSEEVMVLAYPNPTNTSTVLDVRMPEGDQDAQLRVVDVTGRMVVEYNLGSSRRVVEVLTQSWSNGLYFTELWLNGEQAAALKLIVQH